MKIYPHRKIELTTEHSIQEVRKVLSDNIQPEQKMFNRPKADSKLFEGFFERDKFEIHRTIKGRNSFVPLIKGRIESNLNGIKLIADLKVFLEVKVFTHIWLGFMFFITILLIFGISEQGLNPLALLIPILMSTFAITFSYYTFKNEMDKSINDLEKILNNSTAS